MKSKIVGDIISQMPEITRRVRVGKILTFSIDEKVFSKLENGFGMMMGRNIQGMSFSRWMATVPLVSRLSIFDSTRTSRFKPGLFSFNIKESMRNIQLHARDNHIYYTLGTKRRIPEMKAIIIPRKIRMVLPQVLPLRRV